MRTLLFLTAAFIGSAVYGQCPTCYAAPSQIMVPRMQVIQQPMYLQGYSAPVSPLWVPGQRRLFWLNNRVARRQYRMTIPSQPIYGFTQPQQAKQ